MSITKRDMCFDDVQIVMGSSSLGTTQENVGDARSEERRVGKEC